eukprot:13503488-Ditylum_brightwellii.AAC.1
MKPGSQRAPPPSQARVILEEEETPGMDVNSVPTKRPTENLDKNLLQVHPQKRHGRKMKIK